MPHERPALRRSPSPRASSSTGPLGDAGMRAIAAADAIPQSRASAAVVALLDPQPGERVLDLCAGPGVKTTQIAARMRDEGEVVSVELDEARLAELRVLCGRAGASCVHAIQLDASREEPGGEYDRILVDAPCSDLGTLASRPDARWRKSPQLIERLAALQSRILAHAARSLRPGGTLTYSTCTISAREGDGVVAAALDSDAGLRADDLGAAFPALASSGDSRFLQTRPDRDRTSGFFIARLRGND